MSKDDQFDKGSFDGFEFYDKQVKGADGNLMADPADTFALLEYNVLAWRDDVLAGKDSMKAANKYARAVARALLGKDKDNIGVHRWNEPGGIDQFLKRTIGTKETDPQAIVEHIFIKILQEVSDIANRAGEPGVHVDQYRNSLPNMLKKWSYILSGVPPHNFVA